MKKKSKKPAIKFENECLNWTCGEISLKYELKERPSVVLQNSEAVYKFIKENIGMDVVQVQEHFFAIYLNYAQEILGFKTIAKGDLTTVTIDVRQILCIGVILNASAFIVVHNHPSNQLGPSDSDIEVTKSIIIAASACGMALLDHVIVGNYGHYSMLNSKIVSFGKQEKTIHAF